MVAPYLSGAEVPAELYGRLAVYLELLLKWNARTNLTAIRQPEQIVQRHFGEGLFAGLQLRDKLQPGARLLDYGSGAGFPGLPVQLLLPNLRVTLAESQSKKASFLREAVRVLGLSDSATVWSRRVEEMPRTEEFDVVTMRAVDNMKEAVDAARLRVARGGWLLRLTTERKDVEQAVPIPGGASGWVLLERVL